VVAGDVEEAGDVGGRRRAGGIVFVGVAGRGVLGSGGGEARGAGGVFVALLGGEVLIDEGRAGSSTYAPSNRSQNQT
jgi:hypothetical protein